MSMIDDYFLVRYDLDNLIRRLKEGMRLKGRIVKCLGDNRYLLRIWGYNILTESEQRFEPLEEVSLTVRQVRPHLTFKLKSEKHLFHCRPNEGLNHTDIIVH
jgi:hypothetical protein